jgi:NitT/TauT family transport system permease protein
MNKNSDAQNRFLRHTRQKKYIIHGLRMGLLVLLLAAWEVSARMEWIDDFIFSSPSLIWKCARELFQNGTMQEHLTATLKVTLVSFFLVTVLSIGIALLLWMFRGVSAVLEPYLVVLNSLPKSALAPLLIVWLGNNPTTIVVAGISVAIFGSILTLYTNFCGIDPEKVKLIYTLGGTKTTVLFKLLLPGSIPMIISNMKVNIGLCLIGIVIGEMISSKAGLGYLIIYGTQVFKLDWVILSILILCLIAMIFYCLMSGLEKVIRKRF